MAVFASAPQESLLPGPDPQDALIRAVQAGDAAEAARQLERWVHRRGHASLEPLFARVASLQGPAAADWLRLQLEQPVAVAKPPTETAAVAGPPAAPEMAVEPVTVPEPMQEPVAADDPTTAPPAPMELPPLAFELPSFELPSLDPPAVGASEVSAAAAEHPAPEVPEAPVASNADSTFPPFPQEWTFDLEAAFPPLGAAPSTFASGPESGPVSDPIVEEEDEEGHGVGPAPAGGRRGAFARMKSLMRGCLEEAREVLHRFDATGFEGEEEDTLDAEHPDRQPAPPAPPAQSAQQGQPQIPSFLADGVAGPGRAPEAAAPAPSALSDLRSWLPEAEDPFPRAS